jgi:predicted permease
MRAGTEVGSVYREAWRTYRSHPVALLGPGIVLFLVFGLPSALLHEVHTTNVDLAVEQIALVLGVQTLGFTSSFLYYGYCEKVAAQSRRQADVSVRRALADTWHVLPMLITASIVAELVIAIGFLLLILPGIYLLCRFAVVPPTSSFEHAWPRRALRRSRQLTRDHFWFVAATAVAMIVGEQLASELGDTLGAHVLSDETIGRVLGDVAGDLLVGPFAGLVTAVAYFRLSERQEGGP